MIKIKNKELMQIANGLEALGNRQSIVSKWKLAQYSKPFLEKNELLKQFVNELINKKGTKTEDGQMTLSTNDKDYISLMEAQTEIDASFFNLKELEQYHPTMQDLINLEKIIKE